jgi:hypothetical protein
MLTLDSKVAQECEEKELAIQDVQIVLNTEKEMRASNERSAAFQTKVYLFVAAVMVLYVIKIIIGYFFF